MTKLLLAGDRNPANQLYFFAFLLSLVFAAVARKTDYCLHGGVVDTLLNGNTTA
jgi:hypothetical protein